MKRDTKQTKNHETNEIGIGNWDLGARCWVHYRNLSQNPIPNTQKLFRLFCYFSFVSFLSLFICAAGACSRAPRSEQPVIRRYELKGRVESLDIDRKLVTVAHEDIKDYMEAMTMSFAVKDENVLRQLKSGDRLQATLVYDSSTNLSWLEDIKVISTN